jgi:hypothetical protein
MLRWHDCPGRGVNYFPYDCSSEIWKGVTLKYVSGYLQICQIMTFVSCNMRLAVSAVNIDIPLLTLSRIG